MEKVGKMIKNDLDTQDIQHGRVIIQQKKAPRNLHICFNKKQKFTIITEILSNIAQDNSTNLNAIIY